VQCMEGLSQDCCAEAGRARSLPLGVMQLVAFAVRSGATAAGCGPGRSCVSIPLVRSQTVGVTNMILELGMSSIRYRNPLLAILLAATAIAATACDNPTGVEGECQQTGEFGNTGCIEVQGVVLSDTGAPLQGVSVGPRFFQGGASFNTVYAQSDREGNFRFRVSRFSGQPPLAGPDTVSLYVHAADPGSAVNGSPATVRDSVLVIATVAPVGRAPTPTFVTITLTQDE